jgi:hypothetical protein
VAKVPPIGTCRPCPQRPGRRHRAGTDATDAELWRALDIAQAADFVAAMPGQLEAAIDQGGTNVSGGSGSGCRRRGRW